MCASFEQFKWHVLSMAAEDTRGIWAFRAATERVPGHLDDEGTDGVSPRHRGGCSSLPCVARGGFPGPAPFRPAHLAGALLADARGHDERRDVARAEARQQPRVRLAAGLGTRLP